VTEGERVVEGLGVLLTVRLEDELKVPPPPTPSALEGELLGE